MLYAYHGYFSCLSLVIFCALLDITNSSNRFRIEVDKYDPNAVDAHRRSLHHVFMEAAAALNFRDDIVKRDRASASTIHEVVFTVKQSNMEELTRILQDVSDPASDNYGQYKTFQEIADLTSNPQSQNVIVDYLQSAGAKVISQSLSGEFITARAPVHLWEGIFHTEFYVFHHVRSEDAAVQKVVRAGEYSIPSYLHKHVSSVLNTIQMPVAVWGNPVIEPVGNTSNPIQASAVDASHVTCAKLNQLYNIDNNIGSAQSTQAVFGALKQTFSPSDIALFQKFSNLPLQPVQTIIGTQSSETQCMNDHNSCAEASLDLQYIQGIAQISPTTFWYTNDFFTGWLLTVANTANPPLVLSISYGCNENLLSASEFENFNTQAIKLGVMGVTILAASGGCVVVAHY